MIFKRRDGSTFELETSDARIVFEEMQENYLAEELVDDYGCLVEDDDVSRIPEAEYQVSNVRKICGEMFGGTLMGEMFSYDSFSEHWSEMVWSMAERFRDYLFRKYPLKPPKEMPPHRNTRI